jgi:hypothetical protein
LHPGQNPPDQIRVGGINASVDNGYNHIPTFGYLMYLCDIEYFQVPLLLAKAFRLGRAGGKRKSYGAQ